MMIDYNRGNVPIGGCFPIFMMLVIQWQVFIDDVNVANYFRDNKSIM